MNARKAGEACLRLVVRLAARRQPALRPMLPELGKRKRATNERARRLLGWSPRPSEDAIAATGESLVRLGLLKDRPRGG